MLEPEEQVSCTASATGMGWPGPLAGHGQGSGVEVEGVVRDAEELEDFDDEQGEDRRGESAQLVCNEHRRGSWVDGSAFTAHSNACVLVGSKERPWRPPYRLRGSNLCPWFGHLLRHSP